MRRSRLRGDPGQEAGQGRCRGLRGVGRRRLLQGQKIARRNCPVDGHSSSGFLLKLSNGLSVSFSKEMLLLRFLECNLLPRSCEATRRGAAEGSAAFLEGAKGVPGNEGRKQPLV